MVDSAAQTHHNRTFGQDGAVFLGLPVYCYTLSGHMLLERPLLDSPIGESTLLDETVETMVMLLQDQQNNKGPRSFHHCLLKVSQSLASKG
jgi:hypothetical protein